MGRKAWSATSADVSRHGMFLEAEDPPRERFLVKLEVELPGGPLEATAFVSRRVATERRSGVGVQFFALSAQAKGRWDAFIGTLSGTRVAEETPRPTLPADSSTFLIKLRNVDRMIDFFERNVRSGRVQMNTPLLRDVGSAVALIVIHPESEREFMFRSTVVRVTREPSKSMDLELEPVTEKIAARFYEFVATGNTTETMDLQVHPPEPEPEREPEPPTSDVEDDEPLPYAFEVDTTTGDLSIDIELDEEAAEELETLSDLEALADPETLGGFAPPEPLPSGPRAPVDVVAVRCTACGAFLGTAPVDPLPEPLGWVADRRIRFDRFSVQLVASIEPKDDAGLEDGAAEHAGRMVPASSLFDLARRWREDPPTAGTSSDLGPALRHAAAELMKGRGRARVDADCPSCGEPTVFVAPE